jgi:hypothetical protein
MRLGPLCVVALALACTRNPYVVGSVCPADGGADADPRCGALPLANGTLVVGLDQSGASGLGDLELPSGRVAASLRLRGERAMDSAWVSDGGPTLMRGAGAPAPAAGAPFTDGTDAVGLAADAPSYVAASATLGGVGADDFALEVVLHTAPGASVLVRQAGGAGWALRTSAAGALTLELGDGDATHVATIASPPLTTNAWYHCLFWVSRGAGGRADCDGRAGTLAPLPALGALDAPAQALAVGGGAQARVAHVALFRVAPGGLGDAGAWLDESRRRFAVLTGVWPSAAGGTRQPAAGLRDSTAYVDLETGQDSPRQLYLVGEDWPRIAARPDTGGGVVRGYLAEPRRTRAIPVDATAWQPAGVTVSAGAALFADGAPRFAALAPSTAATTHALTHASTAGSVHQVFSFFVHGLGAVRVGASAGAATAVFDLSHPVVLSTSPGARAAIEPWGLGVARCSLALDAAAGPQTFSVQLLDDLGNETFAGAGAPTLEVGGLQVDDGLAFAGSLLGADVQEVDRLTFRADDGNLPSGAAGVVSLRVLVPSGPRINDQAILNLNRGGTYDDQVQLYVRGDAAGAGNVKFWRLEAGQAQWAFDGLVPVTDGAPHDVLASWGMTSALLRVDGRSTQMAVQAPSAASFGLDRIDVGFSQLSSGPLEGLVAGLHVGAM